MKKELNYIKEIKNIALNTIQVEIDALLDLKGSINNDFVICVELIEQSKGRVVITGVGKSAIIAQKIVATLNSTGTSALFMHATDAIHGDLGMINKEDIVICISKSGETPEIKVLIPLLRRFKNTLIGIVSNKNSFLGKNVDYVLHTPIKKEADPNNLAPTASTTAQMAMGDALATALLSSRGFSAADFAKFHPGGTLGKQLYLKVKDLANKHERPQVKANTSLRQIILEMTSKRLGATAVLDENENVIGMITDGDLRRMLTQKEDVSHIQAKDIMAKNPKTVTYDTLAVNALIIIQQHSITQIIVTKKKKYYGMLHIHDLIKEGLV